MECSRCCHFHLARALLDLGHLSGESILPSVGFEVNRLAEDRDATLGRATSVSTITLSGADLAVGDVIELELPLGFEASCSEWSAPATVDCDAGHGSTLGAA